MSNTLWRDALRSSILWQANLSIARAASRRITGSVPRSYIVVTPHLIHMAPLAALNHGGKIQPVFVANGIGKEDIAWLRTMSPGVPVVPLRTSIGNNPLSLLPHGTVIDYLAQVEPGAFFIQDADCFVSDSRFWEFDEMNTATEYAACAFVRAGQGARPEFPETFLTGLNAPLMRRCLRQYGISSGSAASGPKSEDILAEAGYPKGRVLETLKDYYDTLQQYWVVATHQGFHYRRLPGEGNTVHHIGGTSYLYKSFDDLAHWDFWPLAVHYFNLRILELPAAMKFKSRFASIFDFHKSADQLLFAHPDFATGWRRNSLDRIMADLDVSRLFEKAV